MKTIQIVCLLMAGFCLVLFTHFALSRNEVGVGYLVTFLIAKASIIWGVVELLKKEKSNG